MTTDTRSREELLAEIENLRIRLQDAEQTLRAIQDNEVDAFVVATPQGDRIFTLQGAEHPYRVLVESMNEGAATLAPDGSVIYSNRCLADLLKIPLEKLIGSALRSYVAPTDALSFAALLKQGRQKRCKAEIELITGDGNPLAVLLSCSQISENHNLGVVVTDLSEQKRSERTMAAEKLARSIIEQAGEAIVVCDKNGQITRTSQQANRLCGTYPQFRLFDATLPLRIADTDALFSIAEPLHGEVFRNVEVVFKAPHDDQTFSLLLNAIPLKNDQGEFFGCVVTLTDITARKRIEAALSESEERLKLFIQYAPAGLAMFDCGMRYLYASQRWLIDYGLSDRDLRGLSHYDVFPEISAEWKEAHRRGLAGEVVRSEGDRFERMDGSVQWIRWEIRPWYTAQRSVGGIVLFSEDITANKEAAAALQRSEALYRAIGESIDYGVWVCAPDGRNTYASDSFLKLVGLTQEQCSNFGWGDVLHPDDAEDTVAAWRECTRTGGIWDVEHHYRGVDGHYHAILARGVPVKDERGEIVCWAGINLDIQRLKQTEEALRESEQQFRQLADAMPQMAWITDSQGQILFANERWRKFTGLNHEPSALILLCQIYLFDL